MYGKTGITCITDACSTELVDTQAGRDLAAGQAVFLALLHYTAGCSDEVWCSMGGTHLASARCKGAMQELCVAKANGMGELNEQG
jgi:hypothetical protein